MTTGPKQPDTCREMKALVIGADPAGEAGDNTAVVLRIGSETHILRQPFAGAFIELAEKPASAKPDKATLSEKINRFMNASYSRSNGRPYCYLAKEIITELLNDLTATSHPDKAEVVERMAKALQNAFGAWPERYPGTSFSDALAETLARAALSALPPTRDDGGLVEELQAELRHYKGRPAVDGKPLELQSRDELLAHVRVLEAENERLSFEANAGRQAEAEADAEAKELAGALKPFAAAYDTWRGGQAVAHLSDSVCPAHFRAASIALDRYKAQQAAPLAEDNQPPARA